MSNRRAHRAAATIAGGGHALARAKQHASECLLLEVLAGCGSHVAFDSFTPASLPLLA